MNHKFYSKSKKEQNQILMKIGFGALFLNVIMLAIAVMTSWYFIAVLSVIMTLSIIAPFFDVPALRKKGKLIYHSALFIVEEEKKGVIIIHGGTLFEYVFVLDKSLSGKQRTNFILQKYLEGLLNLIEDCEKKHNTSVKIKGTSYVLNERTAGKIGLSIIKTDLLQTLILIFNYPNILISNSIAKGKVAFPRIGQIKSFESEMKELINRKEFIRDLSNKLKM
jgi:hypothetical protein